MNWPFGSVYLEKVGIGPKVFEPGSTVSFQEELE
jgi:hypothetical protein